jgi:hypothetical protein
MVMLMINSVDLPIKTCCIHHVATICHRSVLPFYHYLRLQHYQIHCIDIELSDKLTRLDLVNVNIPSKCAGLQVKFTSQLCPFCPFACEWTDCTQSEFSFSDHLLLGNHDLFFFFCQVAIQHLYHLRLMLICVGHSRISRLPDTASFLCIIPPCMFVSYVVHFFFKENNKRWTLIKSLP